MDSGEQAVSYCRKTCPDVILMDIDMPGISGLEATRQILSCCPDAKVIILSGHAEDPIPTKVMQIGASGFLTKSGEPQEMITAIRKVVVGQKYMTPQIAQQIALSQLGAGQNTPFEQLSQRELSIAMMISKGDRVPAIAQRLNISAKTVNTHRYRMFEKLAVNSDVELTHLAIRHGLIHSEAL